MNNEETKTSEGFILPAPDAVPDLNVERFVFLNPFGGEIFHTGSTVAIYWTGGPPLPQRVGFSLVDKTDWVVVRSNLPGEIVNQSSPGFYQWTIPPDIKLNPTHRYQIYIAASDGSTWTYGPAFSIIGNPPFQA